MNQKKTIKKSYKYRYANIDNYYFCLNQNPAVLVWVLYFKRDNLSEIYTPGSRRRRPRGIVGYLRFWYRLFISNSLLVYKFIKSRRTLLNGNILVELPVYGQVCLPVHKGYKIFNLRSGIVIKYYDADVNREIIKNELDILKIVSSINFAPTIQSYDLATGWFEEDYVGYSIDNSQRSLDSATFLSIFYNDIVPCLNELMLFKKPFTKSSLDYIEEIIDVIRPEESFWSHFDKKNADKVRNFIHTISGHIQKMGNYPVHLIFSHGDLIPANILQTRAGIRIVDWESATYRSLLFDFYSYFFFRINHKKLPIYKLPSEINEALPVLLKKLSLGNLDTPKNILVLENTYRMIYYLESMHRLVKRKMTDNNQNIMDILSRYILNFNQYEDLESKYIEDKNLGSP